MQVFKECRQYNISLWQCPSFLFFVLGMVNIGAMISTYFISNYFTEEPEMTALLTIIVSAAILVIGSAIVHGFDRLLEANKMKTEFIRIASHQLRTPLSALRWANDLLMGGVTVTKPTAEQEEYLEIIKNSNQRMLKLVNDLLDVTKIEMGNLKIVLKPLDLKKIIEDVALELFPLAKASNLSLKFNIHESLPLVFSDADKIRMVVLNLIDNAIKYTKGGGTVSVTAEGKGSFVEVAIKDTGVGIPKDQRKNIFQKFFRSDNAMKHQTVGSGLGLFIVKAIIDSNQGRIWFESEEDKGSSFYFRIPTAK